MLLHYWEKRLLTRDDWGPELAAMGVADPETAAAIEGIISEKGEARVSCYHFQTPTGERGTIVVCHDLKRGVLSIGGRHRWGQWDEAYENLTLDESGERYDFDGTLVYEGDGGSCSLGNV